MFISVDVYRNLVFTMENITVTSQEQAIDREHERDVFQQEIQKLEQQLKIPQRFQPISEHQNREVWS